MNRYQLLAAAGFAALSIGWQDAPPQTISPPVPSKTMPIADSVDPSVIQTSQEIVEKSEPTANSLDELAWMVGDWVDRDESASIESSVNWTKNGKFLTRSFRVVPKNGQAKSGMQLIGWDPAEKTIRSWTYDADGGFGEERWRRTGDRWTIRTKYTLPDGSLGSATNVIRKVDDNTYTWKSANRIIGGSLQPDIDEATVIRKPADPNATPLEQPNQGTANPAPKPSASTDSPKTETQP